MSTFQCPDCKGKISQRNYDEQYEMYECPTCEGMWQFHELVEYGGARSIAGNGSGSRTEAEKVIPRAKGKLKHEQLERDAEADAKQIEEMVKVRKKHAPETRHRDEIETGLVLNVIADEIESIAAELGISMDRTNAREFYAMNLYRPLKLAGIHAREQDVEYVTCEEHE